MILTASYGFESVCYQTVVQCPMNEFNGDEWRPLHLQIFVMCNSSVIKLTGRFIGRKRCRIMGMKAVYECCQNRYFGFLLE